MIPVYNPDESIDTPPAPHACPHVEACRDQALRAFANIPELRAAFEPPHICAETNPAKARRCARMLGLTTEEPTP